MSARLQEGAVPSLLGSGAAWTKTPDILVRWEQARVEAETSTAPVPTAGGRRSREDVPNEKARHKCHCAV